MKQSNRFRQLGSYAAILAVLAVTVALIVLAAKLVPVDTILELRTNSLWTSCILAVGLYVFKCFDFFVHVGLIYSAVGMILPLWGAIVMNLAGTVILTELPYWVGSLIGHSRAAGLRNRFPRLLEAETHLRDNVVIFSMLTRMLGVPLNVLGIYMGAAAYDHRQYSLGSYLGLLPTMACFMVMGAGAADRSNAAFWVAVGVQVLVAVTATAIFQRIKRRNAFNDS